MIQRNIWNAIVRRCVLKSLYENMLTASWTRGAVAWPIDGWIEFFGTTFEPLKPIARYCLFESKIQQIISKKLFSCMSLNKCSLPEARRAWRVTQRRGCYGCRHKKGSDDIFRTVEFASIKLLWIMWCVTICIWPNKHRWLTKSKTVLDNVYVGKGRRSFKSEYFHSVRTIATS